MSLIFVLLGAVAFAFSLLYQIWKEKDIFWGIIYAIGSSLLLFDCYIVARTFIF